MAQHDTIFRRRFCSSDRRRFIGAGEDRSRSPRLGRMAWCTAHGLALRALTDTRSGLEPLQPAGNRGEEL